MSRSGYSDDLEPGELARWRGAVSRAIHGDRGQAFLREMLAAMDALPQPRLIQSQLHENGEVCAIGSVGVARGVDMAVIDIEDPKRVGEAFGISRAMAAEIECINDDDFGYTNETPEQRFIRVRKWVADQIVSSPASGVEGKGEIK